MSRYFYHLTPKSNFDSIRDLGLVPKLSQSRFGPLSPEAHDKKPKIFLLPVLNGVGMKGFLEEWWHGKIEDIALLRMQRRGLAYHQSKELCYKNQEVWCYQAIKSTDIELSVRGLERPYLWRPLW